MQDILDKIANASATKGGNDFRKGSYRLIVDRITLEKDRKGVSMVVPQFRVKTATKMEQDVEPNPVGSSVRCVWRLDKDASPGNIKELVLALVGADEATTPAEAVKAATAQMLSPEQPLRGFEIDCTTIVRINKGRDNPANAGKEMVLPGWQHVPGQTAESVAANRAGLEGTAPVENVTPVTPPPSAPAAAPSGSLLGGILGK
jgi:hypothetical protein